MQLELTKQQRNEIFTIITSHGIDPLIFKWDRIPPHASSTASETLSLSTRFENSNFSFAFRLIDKTTFYCRYSPAISQIDNIKLTGWNAMLKKFNEWVEIVAYEIKQPDLWLQAAQGTVFNTTPVSYSNEEGFNPDEVVRVKEKLKLIEDFIVKTSALRGEDAAHVHQTFIYLAQKTETASKVDWKNLMAGEILAIITGYAGAHGSEIMHFCNQHLLSFFSHLHHLADKI